MEVMGIFRVARDPKKLVKGLRAQAQESVGKVKNMESIFF